MLEPGEQLFKLAVRGRVKEIYEQIETAREAGLPVQPDVLKETIKALSVQY
jgi:hypothetical protein